MVEVLRRDSRIESRTAAASTRCRCSQFVQDFTDQWPGLREIGFTQPDEDLYPEYSDLHLLDSLVRESRAFFAELLRENLPVRHVVDPDFVCINAQLAELYDIDAVRGGNIRKVKLPPQLTEARRRSVSCWRSPTPPQSARRVMPGLIRPDLLWRALTLWAAIATSTGHLAWQNIRTQCRNRSECPPPARLTAAGHGIRSEAGM